ncbi:NACHT, LRR and PYD domains-containing protein 4E [Apodemus speciosus]|uniref:NACHT, LRR and PYD domains-containing protein 4E n=1 Tax=Apodemus speciosus TaxID=105296 RepID=A0ABQ0EWT6_APOSI
MPESLTSKFKILLSSNLLRKTVIVLRTFLYQRQLGRSHTWCFCREWRELASHSC